MLLDKPRQGACLLLKIEELIEKNVEIARQLIAQKRRDKALLALKKKKLQEEQVKKVDAWLLNVEGMVSSWFPSSNRIAALLLSSSLCPMPSQSAKSLLYTLLQLSSGPRATEYFGARKYLRCTAAQVAREDLMRNAVCWKK